MSALGRKVVDVIPDSVHEFIDAHPRVMFAVTVPLVVAYAAGLIKAVRVHVEWEHVVAERASDAARAASEALGG